MRNSLYAAVVLTLAAGTAVADENGRVYKWVDADGVVHFGDSIPAEAADLPKQVLNEHGVTVDRLAGKKTPEEIEAERRAAALAQERELQLRADKALLATYLSVDEILLHRDRRVELFQAQSRVTELYLTNLERRLTKLREEASRYAPYSDDPDAKAINPELVDEITETEATIARHKENLAKFERDEQQIIARFEGDINRFKTLKGIQN